MKMALGLESLKGGKHCHVLPVELEGILEKAGTAKSKLEESRVKQKEVISLRLQVSL